MGTVLEFPGWMESLYLCRNWGSEEGMGSTARDSVLPVPTPLGLAARGAPPCSSVPSRGHEGLSCPPPQARGAAARGRRVAGGTLCCPCFWMNTAMLPKRAGPRQGTRQPLQPWARHRTCQLRCSCPRSSGGVGLGQGVSDPAQSGLSTPTAWRRVLGSSQNHPHTLQQPPPPLRAPLPSPPSSLPLALGRSDGLSLL